MEDKLERLGSEAQDKAQSVNPHLNTTMDGFWNLPGIVVKSLLKFRPPPSVGATFYYVYHPEDSGGPNSRNSISPKFSVDTLRSITPVAGYQSARDITEFCSVDMDVVILVIWV